MATYRCILCKAETEAATVPSRCSSCGAGRDGLKLSRATPRPQQVKREYGRPSIPELLTSLEEQLGKVRGADEAK